MKTSKKYVFHIVIGTFIMDELRLTYFLFSIQKMECQKIKHYSKDQVILYQYFQNKNSLQNENYQNHAIKFEADFF